MCAGRYLLLTASTSGARHIVRSGIFCVSPFRGRFQSTASLVQRAGHHLIEGTCRPQCRTQWHRNPQPTGDRPCRYAGVGRSLQTEIILPPSGLRVGAVSRRDEASHALSYYRIPCVAEPERADARASVVISGPAPTLTPIPVLGEWRHSSTAQV